MLRHDISEVISCSCKAEEQYNSKPGKPHVITGQKAENIKGEGRGERERNQNINSLKDKQNTRNN